MAARITVVVNQKGGIGKTTTSFALTAGLTIKGHKVLAIDLDPQGNLCYNMDISTNGKGIYDIFNDKTPIFGLIKKTPNGDIVTSSPHLTKADKQFIDTGREYILGKALDSISDTYDYIIIDCPPQLGILIINALTACTDIIIPLTADIFAIQGLVQLNDNISVVKEYCNNRLTIDGILLTRYSSRTILNRELKEAIEDKAAELGTRVYDTIIREGISIRESQTLSKSIFDYAPKSNPAIDYMDFINEYMNVRKSN